jgi:prepilin-type N-terminal cleavage/methylation domain-containing protein
MKKSGFTLVEMLVVMGIIAVLAAASMVGYSKVVKSAKKAKNQELVSNAATALTQILNKEGVWPEELVDNKEKGLLDKDTTVVFVRYNLMGLAYNQREANGNASKYRLIGKDRCGLVDSEAEAVLKRNPNATEGTSVPTGGNVGKHILHYAIDEDGDGFTEATVDGAGVLKIRASAVVWAAGPDGKVDYSSLGRNDDVYSWRVDQIKK